MATQLRSRGFDEFAPSFKENRQWSDRIKRVDQLLFPGYVFCRMNPNDRGPVLAVRGVVHIVGFGEGPVEVPQHEIDRVRKVVESGLNVSPFPFLKLGDHVRIERGPLVGLEGLLVSFKGKDRLVVSIDLLQRSVSTEIDRCWVTPVASPTTARPS